jgi:hypothetical protein
MAGSNYQSNKNGVDVSFESSSNHGGFSQAGTPMSYKVTKLGTTAATTNPQTLKVNVKTLISTSTVSGPKLANSNPAASSIERKPKKLILQ